MQKINHEHIMMKWLAALALTRLVLPFLLQNSWYQPHRDEYLYLDYAKHMDWGYMEVPPLLSVFSWLTFHLGNSHFLVKFWPALFGAGTFFLCGHLIIKLGGNLYALLLFFCAFILGAYIRLFFLFQPGFLEVFCWTGIVYTLIRHQLSGQRKWIYLLGIACGMGMLSKYTTAFLITCLMVSLLISRQRHILFTKPFVIAAIIAFCLFLPNLYWQYQHNFPVAFHMEELRQTQLRYVSPVDFLAGQLIMNFVYAFTWITGLIALWFKKSWKPYRWLGFTFLFTIALLMAGSAKDYYALGLYPPIIAVGCLQVERFLQNKNMVVKSSVIALPLAAGIFILPLGLPMFKPAKLAKYYEKAGFTKALGFKWE
ncbi:MAG: glycosyltransferase family 39 protein, partial [Chitinophagaceae bacterium]|nr:glycosyltransferase family 39 protein [Chitinophagaceae bacterium]